MKANVREEQLRTVDRDSMRHRLANSLLLPLPLNGAEAGEALVIKIREGSPECIEHQSRTCALFI
jgi:hypothetical protein